MPQPVDSTVPDAAPYDAVLLLSFGGPEGPEDVVPFLRNVTRGRGIPDERLVEVGAHYDSFGGRSPINDQNRALRAAIRQELAERGIDLRVYWGNRNWHPFLADTLRQMHEDGVRRAITFVTSAYSSYSGCRQYREDLAEAAAAVPGAPELDRLRVYFNHPGFVEPVVDATLAALAELPADLRDEATLLFVTHSVPDTMNDASGPEGGAYVAQHRSVLAEVAARVEDTTGRRYAAELVFCSRSGPPQMPWLEPDVNDRMQELSESGTRAVVLVPVGFVSDHMEVRYDLDTEAMATAEKLGLACVRAATPGVDPRFVGMVVDLVLERAAAERGESPARPCVGSMGPAWDRCEAVCCLNPRSSRPVLGGV